jgi:hypothetical protein
VELVETVPMGEEGPLLLWGQAVGALVLQLEDKTLEVVAATPAGDFIRKQEGMERVGARIDHRAGP